jgi:putative AdoMet-dependent methyltransferase
MQKKYCTIAWENNMPPIDPFPSTEFDEWAVTYDLSVTNERFPFYGYRGLLKKMVSLANIKPKQRVLDLGAGTGNLAFLFASAGCDLVCTDFSARMLEIARQKIPTAHFIHSDLRGDTPKELSGHFDRIVSAYVFHHFELDQKIQILRKLIPFLAPPGWMIIGDISFRNEAEMEALKNNEGDDWEDEFYWLADGATPALETLGFKVKYTQVSACAGIYMLEL